jgi:soluble cytochrome b562
MSAPGIQLILESHVTYFQPTIREYLQGIRDAVASNNLSAARQAFAQLAKAIPVSAQRAGGRANELPTHMSQGMQLLGRALDASDLAAVQHAVVELRASIQSMSDEHGHQGPVNASDAFAVDGGVSDTGHSLNVKA